MATSAWTTYLGFVRGQQRPSPRALCLYASDAEIFDFRPGRFQHRGKTVRRKRMGAAGSRRSRADREPAAELVPPSGVLSLLRLPDAGQTLRLESAACPVPVKKQRKYNLARWAVTGRDNLAINAACQRIYRGMLRERQRRDWKELCYLWASDFRTHLTEKRWSAYCARLRAAEARWSKLAACRAAAPRRRRGRTIFRGRNAQPWRHA